MWPPMLCVHLLQPDGSIRTGGRELMEEEGAMWVDLQAPTELELKELAVLFELHKLEVEDCLHRDQRPKLEPYPGHLFFVLHAFRSTGPDVCALEPQEMHFFLGRDWLLTVHEEHSAAVQEALRRLRADTRGTFAKGVDRVAYLVADALVDSNFPLLEEFSDELETLEAAIFEAPDPLHQQRIFELKRTLVLLRRILGPQRDVVGLLARDEHPEVHERTRLYFRDVADHLTRVQEQLDADSGLIANVRDGYLAMMANRTAEVSKQLTIMATVFLPLSFIVGFFGQNFEVLTRPFFFWLMLGTMVVVPALFFVWFRHKRWL
jgi:magnesium transporter